MNRFTLSQIREANGNAGGLFFSRAAMRHFGDTAKSFRVIDLGASGIFLERLTAMRDRDGRDMGGIGKLYEFEPSTGRIWAISADRHALLLSANVQAFANLFLSGVR